MITDLSLYPLKLYRVHLTTLSGDRRWLHRKIFKSTFRTIEATTIPEYLKVAKNVRYLQLFVGGLMSYIRYLCSFGYSCVFFVLFVFVLCLVFSMLTVYMECPICDCPLRCYLTFIYHFNFDNYENFDKYENFFLLRTVSDF